MRHCTFMKSFKNLFLLFQQETLSQKETLTVFQDI